jgi:futalosine hydrolase
MNCLLIAATAAEVAPALEHYRASEKKWHVDFQLDVLVTGVGLLNSTYAITRYLQIKKPDLLIQAGIAGCFDTSQPLGKVFCVKSDVVADMGVMEKSGWTDMFDLQLQKPSRPPYRNRKLVNPHTVLMQRTRLPKAGAITVNQISVGAKALNTWRDKYNPLLESMEGAALHYIALIENIPFLQLRSISNYAGERNKKNWRMAPSIEAVNKVLIQLFEAL